LKVCLLFDLPTPKSLYGALVTDENL